MSFDKIRLSKKLSWLLRHGANQEGIKLDEEGFVDVDNILTLPAFRHHNFEQIKDVVDSNDKQRFLIKSYNDKGSKRFKIRANQGHSIEINDDLVLKEIKDDGIYSTALHGTYQKNWESIREKGLSRMKRRHIHFASGLPNDSSVKSGIRKNVDLLIYIDLSKALKNGLKFYNSTNNVILTPGDQGGFVTPDYFKEVWTYNPKMLTREQKIL